MSESNGSTGKQLLRPRDGRLLAGVCMGLANYFGIDVNLVRLGFGVFTVFWGLGALVYALAWAMIPEQGEKSSILEGFLSRHRL